MLPPDAARIFAISIAMAASTQADVLLGWIWGGLDPIQASTLFVAGFALVTFLLRLPLLVRCGCVSLATACVWWWESDALYYTAGSLVHLAQEIGISHI